MISAVLAGIGWVLLGLLLLPVFVLVDYKRGVFTARLRVLGLTFRLYPTRKQEKEKAQEKLSGQKEAAAAEEKTVKETAVAPAQPPQKQATARTEQEAEQTAKKEARKIVKKGITLGNLTDVVRAAGSAMRIVFRGLWITGIKIVYPVYRPDAAQTAIAYGRIQAYLGGCFAVLENFTHVRFQKVNIFADFQNEHAEERSFSCKIGAAPIIMITAALYLFKRLKEEKVL